MRKFDLTTKDTKATKGSDPFDLKLRDLRGKFFFPFWLRLRRAGVFVVKTVFGSRLAALGAS
jgi:hypothetical protein